MDRLHQPGTIAARSEAGARGPGKSRACDRAGSVQDDGNGRLRRRAVAGDDMEREGRHRHQFGAPHHAFQAGVGKACRDAARLGNRDRLCAQA